MVENSPAARVACQSSLRRAVLAGGLLCAVAMASAAQSAQPAPSPALPGASTIGPIHRGPDGRIEGTDPTKDIAPAERGPCAAGIICVGKGLHYQTLTAAAAAARSGDVIEVMGGTYEESVMLRTARLVVRGISGRPHFDCTGLRIAGEKACLLLAGPGITLENLEISGAVVSDASGANGACVRNEPNLDFTLHRIVCHSSQNGLLTNGGAITIEGSEFFDNGWNGFTHNVYFSGDCSKVTVRNSIFRDARVGHEFKSRCRETVIENSTFRATRASRALDLPDGGTVTITGGTIVQGPGAQNTQMIGYSPESCRYPGNVTIRGMRIVGNHPDGMIANFDKCPGGAIRLIHVIFEGHRPKMLGNVVVE